jgi:ABC-type antimicrobial peptide transport system permease subunit
MSEVVWSVIIMLGIGLTSVLWSIYYILTLDKNEEKHSSNSHFTKTHK